jgi:L-histidine N-alpha-methyltransferase
VATRDDALAARATPGPGARFRLDVHLDRAAVRAAMADDVRRGLGGPVKSLPPKYFYDAAGSALFEAITRLPEYYLTRAEEALLRRHAPDLAARARPREVVELGSGASLKLRTLLDALDTDGVRYVPLDVDAGAIAQAAAVLLRRYPGLTVHGVVGDFERHVGRLPPPAGRRLVLFLGSTLGNLDEDARHRLLGEVRRILGRRGRFLLGLDLDKAPATLERAYDDAAGVTAAFNRNVLHVINRELRADFEPDRFRHVARYDARRRRVEMHLAPVTPQRVEIRDLDLHVDVAPGETIWTESSYKFTRASARGMLARAGLGLEAWYTDGRMALALAAAA